MGSNEPHFCTLCPGVRCLLFCLPCLHLALSRSAAATQGKSNRDPLVPGTVPKTQSRIPTSPPRVKPTAASPSGLRIEEQLPSEQVAGVPHLSSGALFLVQSWLQAGSEQGPSTVQAAALWISPLL